MKLRVLALLALTGALVPLWASEVITHDMRVNRQRITTVLNVPGALPIPPCPTDRCANRLRTTTLYDLPGTVRNALPYDRQIDRGRLDAVPRPRPFTDPRMGLPAPTPGGGAAAKPGPGAPPVDKEEVGFEAETQEAPKGKADAPAARPATVDRSKMIAEKVTVVDWRAGRQFKDDKGRVWCLILGQPEPAPAPAVLDGWLMQAADSPILFFTRTGRMWRLVTMPLP